MELKHLEFKEEVLKKQKELLAKFANDVSTVHSMKVHTIPIQCFTSVCKCKIEVKLLI